MSRLQAATLYLSVLLLACTATAYITYTRYRYTQDDTWHAGFWQGHGACWASHQQLPGATP